MRHRILFATVIILTLLAGCSSGDLTGPVSPSLSDNLQNTPGTNRQLMSVWDVYIDESSGEAEVAMNRTAMSTFNVTGLVEAIPGDFLVYDFDIPKYLTEGLLEPLVKITHPFAGNTKYNGFDVWCVLMTNGSGTLNYNGVSVSGENDGLLTNADGYTRWFNYPEFSGSTLPLVSYIPGGLSTIHDPNATINPYKVFCDGIDPEDDFGEFISAPFHQFGRGMFRAGNTNIRRFKMKFPVGTPLGQLKFSYSIIASWKMGDPTLTGNPNEYEVNDFPIEANLDEPFYLGLSTTGSELYHKPDGELGGTFRADVSVFDWGALDSIPNYDPVPVINDIEKIIIEANFIPGGISEWTQSELPAISSANSLISSVYSIEIPDCMPSTAGLSEFWVIVESAGDESSNYNQGFPGSVYPDARRAAYSRAYVNVSSSIPGNTPPVVTGIEDSVWGGGQYLNPITKEYTDVTYTALYDDPDSGQTHTSTWWIVPDGTEPIPGNDITMPVDWSMYNVGEYDIYVEVSDGFDSGMGGPFDITLNPDPAEGWSDPTFIASEVIMPRAVETPDGKLVVLWYKNEAGIYFAVNAGVGWSVETEAYKTTPQFLHIVAGESGSNAYAGYNGTGGDAGERHALKWTGQDGNWDYMPCFGPTVLPSIMLPDDDGSFTHIYTTEKSLDLLEFDSWESAPGSFLSLSGDNNILFSSCNFAVRGANGHVVAFSRDNGGMKAARVVRISKTDVNDSELITIEESNLVEQIDAPSLCIDTQGVIHAAWKQSLAESAQLRYSNSSDGGQNWSTPITVLGGFYPPAITDTYVGIASDSNDRIYITYCKEPYVYMVYSDDGGETWSEPSSPYEKQLPLGWHWTSAYPVVTSDDQLHVFFIVKNEFWPDGSMSEVIYTPQ